MLSVRFSTVVSSGTVFLDRGTRKRFTNISPSWSEWKRDSVLIGAVSEYAFHVADSGALNLLHQFVADVRSCTHGITRSLKERWAPFGNVPTLPNQ